MRYAITDVGSNTVKMSVYDMDTAPHLIFSHSTPVGLAAHRQNNVLSDEGIVLLSKTLYEYRRLAETVSCDRFACIATAGLRHLENTDRILREVYAQSGVNIEIICGEREAELAFTGLVSVIGVPEDGLLLDMGGASTEIITISCGRCKTVNSLEFGALKLYRQYVSDIFPTDSETKVLHQTVVNLIREKIPDTTAPGRVAYLTGGTVKSIAKLIHSTVQGEKNFVLTYHDFVTLQNYLRESSYRHLAVTRVPDRIHMITPGLIAILAILSHFDVERAIVVNSGIRDGYIAERCQEIL